MQWKWQWLAHVSGHFILILLPKLDIIRMWLHKLVLDITLIFFENMKNLALFFNQRPCKNHSLVKLRDVSDSL